MTPPVDLQKIWSEYRAGLTAFLRTKVDNPADADELLQEILLKAHRNRHTLNETPSLKAWLYRIAKNSIIDFYRKRARDAAPHADDLWYQDMNDTDRHILECCVDPFINALPPETAALLKDIELSERSQKDYAAANGIPYSTLKTRIQSARKQLRGLFDACCDFTFDANGTIVDYRHKPNGCAPC